MGIISTIFYTAILFVSPVSDSVWVNSQRDTVVEKKRMFGLVAELSQKKNELEEVKKSSSHLRYKQLEKNLADSSKVITSLKEQISSLLQENAALQTQIKELADIKSVMIDNMVRDANQWLSSSFANLNISTLVEALPKYEKYLSESKDIEDVYSALKALKTNSDLYANAQEALHVRYNTESIKSLIEEGTKAKNLENNTQRQAEWEAVLNLLSNYGDYYEVLRDLVKIINDEISGASPSRWSGIQKNILDTENEQYKTESYIESIPWLKEQWNKYKTAVERGKQDVKDEVLAVILSDEEAPAQDNSFKPVTR